MATSKQVSRIIFVVAIFCATVSFVGLYAQQPSAPSSVDGRKLPLKEQLTLGLKAVTKEDKAFIDKVVSKVDQGVLPRPLVDSTFLWARQRANRASPSMALRPMVYFRPGLLARAKKMRLDFD